MRGNLTHSCHYVDAPFSFEQVLDDTRVHTLHPTAVVDLVCDDGDVGRSGIHAWMDRSDLN